MEHLLQLRGGETITFHNLPEEQEILDKYSALISQRKEELLGMCNKYSYPISHEMVIKFLKDDLYLQELQKGLELYFRTRTYCGIIVEK